jgi:hypothetical protein
MLSPETAADAILYALGAAQKQYQWKLIFSQKVTYFSRSNVCKSSKTAKLYSKISCKAGFLEL